MIPQKIHYIWFGSNSLPPLANKIIMSWKRSCPSCEIILWNEFNLNVNLNDYTKFCFKRGHFAHLSDYFRHVIIYEHGGVYLDVDIEIYPDFINLFEYDFFFVCYSSIEHQVKYDSGYGFGSSKKNALIKKIIESYDQLTSSILNKQVGTFSPKWGNSKIESPVMNEYLADSSNKPNRHWKFLSIDEMKSYSLNLNLETWVSSDEKSRVKDYLNLTERINSRPIKAIIYSYTLIRYYGPYNSLLIIIKRVINLLRF